MNIQYDDEFSGMKASRVANKQQKSRKTSSEARGMKAVASSNKQKYGKQNIFSQLNDEDQEDTKLEQFLNEQQEITQQAARVVEEISNKEEKERNYREQMDAYLSDYDDNFADYGSHFDYNFD